MIQSHDDLKAYLALEKAKYKNIHVLWAFFPIAEQDVIWKYQWILRHTECYKNTGRHVMFALFNVWHKRMSTKYGIHIPVNTCEEGLKIMHTGPILINRKAKVGKNVSLHINTAIVAHGNRGGVPTIGNGVVLGVGAVILGDVKLADNIAVGANAVVNKSFDEENIAIAGVPARKISNNGRRVWAGVEERKEN